MTTEGKGVEPFSWWQVDLYLHWDDREEEPAWYMGPMIANEVLLPVIKQRGDDLFLWRFHRRAADDKDGHNVSFIFYSSLATAQKVFVQMQANPMLSEMMKAGLVDRVRYPSLEGKGAEPISDTSDPIWPKEVRETWPIYIMGASQMWMMLTEKYAALRLAAEPEAGLDEKVEIYKGVEADLEEVWQDKGSHAFLHHLNSLFAYKPLRYYETRLMRF